MVNKKVTRRGVFDPITNRALRDIYDELDKLQPITNQYTSLREDVDGMLSVTNSDGPTTSSMSTTVNLGGTTYVDINSNFQPVGTRNYIAIEGTLGRSKRPIKGESVKYNDSRIAQIISANGSDKVLLKNDSGVLKVRNSNDTDDATIQAKSLKLLTGAADGEDKEFVISYSDTNYTTFTVDSTGRLSILPTTSGSSVEGKLYWNGVTLALDGESQRFFGMGDRTTDAGGLAFAIYGGGAKAGGTVDLTGGNLQLQGGTGVGTGKGGDIIFQTAESGGSSNNVENGYHTAGRVRGDTGVLEMYRDITLGGLAKVTTLSTDSNGLFEIATNDDGVTTAANITLDADGDIILEAAGGNINADAPITLTSTTADQFKILYDTNNYALMNVNAQGDLEIETVGAGTTDSDITLNADGGIYLDADNGEARLTNAGGTFTPAHAADATTKAYVDSFTYETKVCNFYASSGTTFYLPLAGYIIEGTSTSGRNEYQAMIAPYDGTIEKFAWRSEAAQGTGSGTMRFSVVESTDGTEVPGIGVFRKDLSSLSIADDTYTEYDLSSPGTGTFPIPLTKGRIYSVAWTCAATPYDTNCILVFKWDLSS